MRFVVPATALALTGAAALVAVPGIVRAADETPRDAVERLMPQLMSEDAAVRADAEKQLFALGEPGRAELERVTRETDPRRAITALRLLQDRKWRKAKLRDGEERAQREGDAKDEDERDSRAFDLDIDLGRLDDLRGRIEREVEEMRRRFQDFDKSFTWHLGDLDELREQAVGRSSGTIVENGRRTSWTVEDDGRVKVTIQEGRDAPEKTYEAESFDELKKEHPDVAERVEKVMPKKGYKGFVFRWDPQGSWKDPFGDRDASAPLELESPRLPQGPVLGVELSAVPDVLREHLDLGSAGVVVEVVVKGSLAEKLGLARHDVLLELNGRVVVRPGDVRRSLEGVKAGDTVKAVVVRKGQRKSLEATK